MSPKLAVLMCAYNSESFIREAIESILNQTYKDFEFVIIENGSTDRTWDIIKSYHDSRIRAYRTELKQLIFNLNYGLLQTKAEFVARMDADDIAKPERFERQLAYLSLHPETTVLGTAFELFGNTISSKIVTLPKMDKAIRMRLPFIFSICHPSVMFRRAAIQRVGGYIDGKDCEDLALWLRLSRDKSVKFANLSESLLKYRISPNQVKGSRESYATIVGLLLRESFLQRSPRFFMATILACFKIFRAYK